MIARLNLVLIIYCSPTLRKESDLTRADMIRFAYWTCLQFERFVLYQVVIKIISSKTDSCTVIFSLSLTYEEAV